MSADNLTAPLSNERERETGDDASPRAEGATRRLACQARNLEGGPCGQNTVGESGWCLWHDPDRTAEAAEVRRRGQERHREVRAEEAERAAVAADDLPPPLELTIPALLRRLAWIHQQIAAGKIDPKVGHELVATVREMNRMVRDRDVEDRLRAALAQVKELQAKQGIRRMS